MKHFFAFAALGSLLLLLACQQEVPSSTSDYLVVGTTYGECISDCATLYLIQDGKVYADTETWYSFQQAAQPKFAAKPLPDTAYQFATGQLLTDFPAYLMAHPDTTLGCPDCHDQGGYHLIRMVADVRQAWYIDTDTAALPMDIRAYMQRVKGVVGSL